MQNESLLEQVGPERRKRWKLCALRITLACTECKQRNYNMTKEKKNHPERMETKKYCKFCHTHTLHKGNKVITEICEVMLWKNRNLRITAEEKLVSRDFSQNFEKIVWTDRHTGKADCCGRIIRDHPGSGYQCRFFRPVREFIN